ncbi:hypothetical protein [Vibrio sp. CyArs1]|uniref:hypothetical protein n=1 Tax=Vibrio sp. CyArs1 TaxID=2682577 RepID=UPI001F068556|nr:hypothetical protein [Vibrio sp. CyArs1]
METMEFSVIAYFANAVGLGLILCLAFGVIFKVGMVASAVFAYPVYLAIFALEMFIQKNRKDAERKFFRLNIPAENPKRFIMNTCATIVLLFMLPNFFALYSILSLEVHNEVLAVDKLVKLMFGSDKFQLWCNALSGLFVLVIFAISYFTEVDSREPFEKIEQLSIPSLWKSVLKPIA